MIPETKNQVYEKVKIGDFIFGVISDIKYDMEHKFTYKDTETICPGVRIVFKLDGYKFEHGTRWMKFNYGEKANLYLKYLAKLVEGAKPNMKFDLDLIKGMKIKTIWAENGDYQNIENIFPIEGKIQGWEPVESEEQHEEGPEIPF